MQYGDNAYFTGHFSIFGFEFENSLEAALPQQNGRRRLMKGGAEIGTLK